MIRRCRIALLASLFLLGGRVSGLPFFVSGPVFDPARLAKLQTQYTEDVNKLNLLGVQDQQARDQLTAFLALDKAYGDGSGVAAYVPNGVYNIDPALQKAVLAYANALPHTPAGQAVANFLRRQQDREQVLAVYVARLAQTAALQQKSQLSLAELAAIRNQLVSQGMEVRLAEIAAQADAHGLNAQLRQYQNDLREFELDRQALEKAVDQR